MKVLWISAGLIALTEICFGIPKDGYHKHVPGLRIIAAYRVAEDLKIIPGLSILRKTDVLKVSEYREAIMQGSVGPRFNPVVPLLYSLTLDHSDSFEKTAHDILSRKKDKNEAYIAACCSGTEASRFTAQRLVEHGVGSGVDRATALEWAAGTGHEEAFLLLLNPEQEILSAEILQVKNNYLLRMAALHGKIKAVECLIDYPIAWQNINAIHAEDDAALRNAASRGFGDVVKMLVEHGANIHAFDDQALRNAVESGHVDMVGFLLKNGANASALDNEALKFATVQLARNDVENSKKEAYTKIVELLKQQGAFVAEEVVAP